MRLEAELVAATGIDWSARLELVTRFVASWFGVRPQGSSMVSMAGAPVIPQALRVFHEKMGGSLAVMNRQNRLLPLQEVHLSDRHLVFAVENQGVYSWATGIESDDSR